MQTRSKSSQPRRGLRRRRAQPTAQPRGERAIHGAQGNSGVSASREPNFLLARPEKRLLRAISRRLPRWVLSDDLPSPASASATSNVDADFQLLAAAVNLSRLAVLGLTGHRGVWTANTA